VSTNNGGGVTAAPVLGGYRVNAAAAKYSRVVAARVYRTSARPRGYIYGGSGGAYQAIGALENTDGVWDGGVPMVPGVPNAIPSFQASQVLGLRVLADKLPQIADAVAVGGSGDPYAGLTAEQQGVLREVTKLGFPLRGWWQYTTLSGGAYPIVQSVVRGLDPRYVDDFYSLPGYEGTDPAVAAARVRFDATVQSLAGSPTSGLVLSGVPSGELTNADLIVTSGAAAGRSVLVGTVTGTTVGFGFGADPAVTGAIRPGDHVRIDNSWLLALQYYQRHQVPAPDAGEYGWDQYRRPDGTLIYPQRPLLTGPPLAANAGGAVPNGHFHGKMIMLASTMDVQAYPWSADWYRTQAASTLGHGLDGSYRLWYQDNTDHIPVDAEFLPFGPPVQPADAAAHIVSYIGEYQQALLDLDAWVTRGTPPPSSTSYTVDADTQIHLAATARGRKGLQPVVALTATAGHGRPTASRLDVRAGQPVNLSMRASVPAGAGTVVRVEWDFTGAGTFTTTTSTRAGPEARAFERHSYARPGTYFAVVRVTSQRHGNQDTPFTLIENLASVRIVVH
jgi:hypothetical protein